MTTKVKVYAIKLPLTLKEWRKGSRYILTKLTTSEVQIVYHTMSHDSDCITTKTHKVLDVKNKVPYIIRKLIPDTACVVDEFSTNIDSVVAMLNDPSGNTATGQVYNIETKLGNKDGIVEHIEVKHGGVVEQENMGGVANQLENIDASEQGESGGDGLGRGVHVEVKDNEGKKASFDAVAPDVQGNASSGSSNLASASGVGKLLNKCTTVYKNRCFDARTFSLEVHTVGSEEPQENPFNLTTSHKTEWVDFRSYNKTNLTRVGSRDYSGEWEASFPTIVVYKCVEVSINKFGLGWIVGEIDKMIRNLLVSVQQRVVESYDEWVGLSEEEIQQLESEMIQKFILKIE